MCSPCPAPRVLKSAMTASPSTATSLNTSRAPSRAAQLVTLARRQLQPRRQLRTRHAPHELLAADAVALLGGKPDLAPIARLETFDRALERGKDLFVPVSYSSVTTRSAPTRRIALIPQRGAAEPRPPARVEACPRRRRSLP
jgi:hypothetical protein